MFNQKSTAMKKFIMLLAVAVCLLGTAYASPCEGKQHVNSDVGCSISDYTATTVSDFTVIDNLSFEGCDYAMPVTYYTMPAVVAEYATPPCPAVMVTHSTFTQFYTLYEEITLTMPAVPERQRHDAMRCTRPCVDYCLNSTLHQTMRSYTDVTHAEYVKRE